MELWLVIMLCVVSFGVGIVLGAVKRSWKLNKKKKGRGY